MLARMACNFGRAYCKVLFDSTSNPSFLSYLHDYSFEKPHFYLPTHAMPARQVRCLAMTIYDVLFFFFFPSLEVNYYHVTDSINPEKSCCIEHS